MFSSDTGGEIALTFSDHPNPVRWTALADRPFGDARVRQTQLRTACLDYRGILQTSFAHQGNEVNLFDLLVNHLLANLSVTISGGRSKILRELWESVRAALPTKNTAKQKEFIDNSCDEFNSILKGLMPTLERETERLLAYFTDCNVVLHLKPIDVIYVPEKRELCDAKILLEVDFNNQPTPAHHHFLNEARLSAIAISIYLASILISIPPPLAGEHEWLKLLVLDDVVIGLDLSNRLPLLDILKNEFPDWQILLMTYDKVWFDMVRMRNPESEWECEEIYSTEALYPVHRGRGDYLQKARKHLRDNDDQAAAMYARAEFERKLKKYCEDLSVKLPFRQNLQKLDTEKMLNGLEAHLQGDPRWATDPAWQTHYPIIFTNLRTARKVVLNPLSHSQLVTLARPEVQSAIDAVAAFTLIP